MPWSNCGMLPPRSVRPIEPAKRTSPPKTKGGSNSSQTKTTEPGLWPGISRTSKRESGDFDPFAVGDQAVGLGAGDRQSERSAHVGLGSRSKSGLVATDDQRARREMPPSSPRLPAIWSAWPCVLRIAARRSLRRRESLQDRLGVESGIDHDGVARPLRQMMYEIWANGIDSTDSIVYSGTGIVLLNACRIALLSPQRDRRRTAFLASS